MFREALKHGCYELQLARDTWRNACGPEGMDADLVKRYIEARSLRSPIVLSGITVHCILHRDKGYCKSAAVNC